MADLPPSTEAVRSHVTVADTTHLEQRVTPSSHLDIGTLTVTLMSSGDTSNVTTAQSVQVEQEFSELAERWYLDTGLSSSYLDKILHPAYQTIISLGPPAIPYILRELAAMPDDWFWALRILGREDPVRPEQAGDMQAMADAWLEWGTTNEYI